MKISYDYTDLIDELDKLDLKFNDLIYFKRKSEPIFKNYKPIIKISKTKFDGCEFTIVLKLRQELTEWNAII